MRIIKYIISATLLAAICFFIVESYAQHVLGGFEVEYATVRVTPEARVNAKDVSEAARRRSVECFAEDYQVDDAFSQKITFYCTPGMEDILKESSLVEQGVYESLFFGTVEVRVRPLKEFASSGRVVEYSAHGDAANIRGFSEDVNGELTDEGTPGQGQNQRQHAMSWLFALLSTVMLTLYDIALRRKEALIRLVSGQDLKWFAAEGAAADCAFYGVCFCVSFVVCGRMSSLEYYFQNAMPWALLIVAANAGLYFTLLLTDHRKDVHIGPRAKRVLKISYLYKIAAVLVTLGIVNGCVGAVLEGAEFYEQKRIFQEHKDYNYVVVNLDTHSPDFKRSDQMGLKLYKDYLKKEKTFTMVEINDPGKATGDYVYADAGALPYLEQKIPQLRSVDWKRQVYFILPVGTKESEKASLKKAFDNYYQGVYAFDEIEYEGDVELLACDGSISDIGMGTTKLKENPPIALNRMTEVEQVDPYVVQSAMLDITDEELRAFKAANELEGEIVYKTNAYENFSRQWSVKKGGVVLGIALACAMLLIETLLIYNVLRYEFQVNARELALRKTLGHSLLERYQRLLSVTLSCTILGGICMAAASYFLHTRTWLYMVFGAGLVILIEAALILGCVRKLERKNIQRILKGSVL